MNLLAFVFFTFQGDEKRGGGRYDDEEYAYDALNDETFGANSKEVWDEALHENLSRIEGKIEGPAIPPQESDEEYDSDLDINFDRLKLDDCDIAIDDTDLYKIQLDPSVWTSPDNKYNKPLTPSHKTAAAANRNNYSEPDYGRQQNYQQTPTLAQQTNALQQLIGATPTATTKMMSLEDIERNLINQQLQQQQHKMIQEKLVAIQTKVGQ